MNLISKVSDSFFKFIDLLAEKFDLPTSYNDPRSPVYQAIHFDEATLKRLTKRAEEVFVEGDHDKAINILKYVLSKSPDYHPALNNLATILFVKGEIEKSLALFARAYRVCKTDRDLLLNYAEALKHIGKGKEAEELIKKANDLEVSHR